MPPLVNMNATAAGPTAQFDTSIGAVTITVACSYACVGS